MLVLGLVQLTDVPERVGAATAHMVDTARRMVEGSRVTGLVSPPIHQVVGGLRSTLVQPEARDARIRELEFQAEQNAPPALRFVPREPGSAPRSPAD